MRLSSVLYSTALLYAAQLIWAADTPTLPDASINQERSIECPAHIDARTLNDEKSLKEAVTKKVLKDIPYKLEAVSQEFTLTTDNALQGKYWVSKEGKVTLEEEGSRVSQASCFYADYDQPDSQTSFTLTFNKKFKVHVAKHLPEFASQNVFGSTICSSDEKGYCELLCTIKEGDATAQVPYCKFTPAFVIVSNKIEGPRKSPQNFGVLFVYPYTEGSEKIQVAVGSDVIFPIKRPESFALKLETPRTGMPFTLTHLCMQDAWGDADLYAAYGVSPHITVTGKIDQNGMTSLKGNNVYGYGCTMSCSVRSPDCWGGIFRWFSSKKYTLGDLYRNVLLSRLGVMHDATSTKKSNRQLQLEVEKADLFKEHNYTPTEIEKKMDIEALKRKLNDRESFIRRFEGFLEVDNMKLTLEEMMRVAYANVLQISTTPTMKELRKAFKELSLIHHPDKKGTASETLYQNGVKEEAQPKRELNFADITEANEFYKQWLSENKAKGSTNPKDEL